MSKALGNSAFARGWWMAGILTVECILATATHHAWLHTRIFTTYAIFFFAALLFFGRDKLRALPWSTPPVHKGWAALHGCALALFGATNTYLSYSATAGSALERGALWVWYAVLVLLPVTLGGALFGLAKFLLLLRSLGSAWGLAAACDVLMIAVRTLLFRVWDRPDTWIGHKMQGATFRGVKFLLGLFYPDVFRDPAHFVVGTRNFSVIIEAGCSGIEGLALMLSLTVGWLLYARRELRMWRALLLVPLSLALIWLLNMLRLAALIAIGDAGHPAVALGGFHSQAGWILFSCVALGFLLSVNNVSWFRSSGPSLATVPISVPQGGGSPLAKTNLAAVYLLPFLAILAAGLLTVAASDGFEWMYSLRLIAALAVFYAYRNHYLRMDWRFGWLGPAAGVLVFAFWIALDHWIGRDATTGSGVVLTGVAEGLARLSAGRRAAWIVVRTLAAVTTVPLAEELAFRGYIARRLMSANVESIPYGSLSVAAVLASSLAFGILHGRMWLAGTLAGVVFAMVAKLRGRLGEAVAAHATANLLIALWVITRGDYWLW